MKLLIFLPFFFVGERVQAQTGSSTETPGNLLRLVCEKNNYRFFEKLFPDRVFVLEQVSNDDSLSANRVNGSDFIAVEKPPWILKVKVQFKLNIYNTGLVSDGKTKEQVIDELLGRKPDLSYDGFVHRDRNTIVFFDSLNPEESTIDMSIHLDKYLITTAIMIGRMGNQNENGKKSAEKEMLEKHIASEVSEYVGNWGWFYKDNNKYNRVFENGFYLCRDPVLL